MRVGGDDGATGTVVLDSWAVLRLLEGVEPASGRVQRVIDEGDAILNAINLGEVHYVLRRAHGEAVAISTTRDLESAMTVVVPDRDLILDAARIKADHPLSYADAFAAATAVRHSAPLWTGDPELLLDGVAWQAFDPSVGWRSQGAGGT